MSCSPKQQPASPGCCYENLSAAVQQRLKESPRTGYIRLNIAYGKTYQLFDMKRDKTFHSPMQKFAEKINQELSSLRFHFDGVRVRETDTPASLEMDESDVLGNTIEVNVMQIGG
ncbi:hypothetical protein C8R44DRAFT_788583 [Mycena epipterygia]|nr:hypothetical protein C8R44DRAFT_788583 [Mycena epipterygia]